MSGTITPSGGNAERGGGTVLVEDEPIAELVGRRLRYLRRSCGLTMADVARASAGRWRTSSIGNYERGTRSMGLSAVAWFADYYGVSPSYFLDGDRGQRLIQAIRVTLDLRALAEIPDAAPVLAIGSHIAGWRGVPQTDRITLRQSDTALLAAALGTSISTAIARLGDWGSDCRDARVPRPPDCVTVT